MKLHQSSKTIRIKTLDGKMEKRTIYSFAGAMVSVEANPNTTKKATSAFKNYFTKK